MTCDACGGKHRLMEICPAKPGLLELLGMWQRGERTALAWIAFLGVCSFVVLAVLFLGTVA